jgi:hypothetical protein
MPEDDLPYFFGGNENRTDREAEQQRDEKKEERGKIRFCFHRIVGATLVVALV